MKFEHKFFKTYQLSKIQNQKNYIPQLMFKEKNLMNCRTKCINLKNFKQEDIFICM